MASSTYRFISPLAPLSSLCGLAAAARSHNLVIVGGYLATVLVVVAVLASISARISSDGVAIRRVTSKRSIDWAEVSAARAVKGKIVLNLQSGEAVTLPAPTAHTLGFKAGLQQVEQCLVISRGSHLVQAASPA